MDTDLTCNASDPCGFPSPDLSEEVIYAHWAGHEIGLYMQLEALHSLSYGGARAKCKSVLPRRLPPNPLRGYPYPWGWIRMTVCLPLTEETPLLKGL